MPRRGAGRHDAVWIALVALATLSIAEAVAIVALARELGLMSLRLPPVPALESGDGPALNVALPPCEATDLSSGKVRSVDGGSTRARVLLFLSTSCDACHVVLEQLNAVEADWPDHEFIPVVSGAQRDAQAMQNRSGFRGALYHDPGEAMRKLDIRVTPAGIVVDPSGTVVAKGVENSREMVSSLLTRRIRVNHELVERELLTVNRLTSAS